MRRSWLLVLSISPILPAFDWDAALRVEKTGEIAFAGRSFPSSTRLKVTWSQAPVEIRHYLIEAGDGRTRIRRQAPPEAREFILDELKSATTYRVSMRACLDAECQSTIESATVEAATEEEYWRVTGTGNTFAGASRLVTDGNVNASALRYGEWAGEKLAGRVQLYYVPTQASEKGIKIGEMFDAPAIGIDAFLHFLPVSGYGLMRVCSPPPPGQQGPGCPAGRNLVTQLALFQPVALTESLGGGVRLFFESQASDGRTRVLYLDSQDGYAGRDFHRGAPTRCNTFEDYAPGGGCEPTIAIGVDSDGDLANPNLRNARQFKIGWPDRDAGLWDGAPGTWMWFTTEYPDRSCSEWGFNFAYAVWDGGRWVVQYGEDGCPKLMRGSQAMAPMHLGGSRWKMYFNHHREARPTPGQPPIKPVRVIYSDAAFTGSPDQIEFEDWEPRDLSRNVNFLWSDGAALTIEERSRFDDMFVYMPTGDRQLQIMYSNMAPAPSPGAPPAQPFIGSAVLLNP
jgi:hypothetical protein